MKKDDLGVSDIEGKFAVVSIDGTTIYVSYMDNATKFYTIRGGTQGVFITGGKKFFRR